MEIKGSDRLEEALDDPRDLQYYAATLTGSALQLWSSLYNTWGKEAAACESCGVETSGPKLECRAEGGP